jgi:hypothetical protein
VSSTNLRIGLLFLPIPKQVSMFLEFTPSAGIFFKTKNLWKHMFLIQLPLLWMLQLPIATMNFM